MELKVKVTKWSTGTPISLIHQKTADKVGVHSGDRVFLKTIGKNSQEFFAIVNTQENFIRENQISVSVEMKNKLGLKNRQKVEVHLAPTPKSLFYIKQKLIGKSWTQEETNEIIKDVVSNLLSEAEIALFISLMYSKGMTHKETVFLIKAILNNGEILKLNNKYIVDKHCIGGIPGNRTTPIVVAICAAAGLTMPKNSSRAITSAAGTADTIETLAKVDFSIDELKKIVQKTNGCLVWGGALGMVPADSKIIQIEKKLKMDPEAQLLASIMSKKLAAGSKYVLIDIPYGKNAKVSYENGLKLKTKFEKIAKEFKIKLKVVLTKGDQPIGNGIGPALEMNDVLNCLNPLKEGPKDLEDKSIFLAGEIFEMTNHAKKGKGIILAREIFESGKAYKKFEEIIIAQKGGISCLPEGKFKKDIFAKSSGKIIEIHNKKINSLARIAGCPTDKFAGVYSPNRLNNKLKKGDLILTIYAESKSRLDEAIKFYKKTRPIMLK